MPYLKQCEFPGCTNEFPEHYFSNLCSDKVLPGHEAATAADLKLVREIYMRHKRPNAFISGRKNCHLKGLNSYVLRNRINDAEGMLRIFHNTGDCLPGLIRDGKYCLAPHNHRQDITLTLLCGSAVNVTFKWDSRAPEKHFREWVFRSEIVDGEIAAHYHGNGDLRVTGIEPLGSVGLFLPASQIHTVVASPGAAWLVSEGDLAAAGSKSLCYSIHTPFALSSDGLYEDLSAGELEDAWAQIGEFVPSLFVPSLEVVTQC